MAQQSASDRQQVERWAAALGGTVLAAYALQRRSWRSLGVALAGAPLVYRGATGRWPAERALAETAARPATIEASVTVERTPEELYAFWRKLPNLPRFMHHLESVDEEVDGTSRWVGRSPLGFPVEWRAEIVEDRAGQLLSWRSLPGSQVATAGSVLFTAATGGRGTAVRVTLHLSAPGAGLGRAVSRALSPLTEHQVREDLRRFKQLMEAGEIPRTDAQPAGKRSLLGAALPLGEGRR